MNQNLKKFSLYLQIKGTIDYIVTPIPDESSKENDLEINSFLLDVNKPNTIKIKVFNKKNAGLIIIKKMLLNNTEVNHINPPGVFIYTNKKTKVNNNWLDDNGEFIIRLHGNAVSHNFLNYMLSLTKSSK